MCRRAQSRKITTAGWWGGRRSQPDHDLESAAGRRIGAADVFGPGGGKDAEPVVDVKALHAKIGELTLENDFLLNKAGLRIYRLRPRRS
jgi:hypothetical protein